jgi:hypothetical protein
MRHAPVGINEVRVEMDGIDYFTEQTTRKEIEDLIEDLDFWFDKVFLHQTNKSQKDAEFFLKQLARRLNVELDRILWDRKLGS